ncbi:TonB-dependent receptor [Mucilaginibacter sp.]|uniref:TonB-dependent receptor n=1 Tax=Mucilaginibacter sp. TaxID=1882438 RepID=UPI0035651AB9
MKFVFLLLTVTCLQVNAKVFSQDISIVGQNLSLKNVFKEINKQSGYLFIYSDEILQKSNPVTLNITKGTLEQVLDKCFENQPLTYQLIEKTIVVKANTLTVKAPPLIIKGIVVDENGGTIPGVSVKIKGTLTGTVTDNKGNYTISIPGTNNILVFSFVGYKTKEIQVNSAGVYNVVLEPNIRQLEETIVIGYGQVRKSDLTGAISKVNMADLGKAPVIAFTEALAGRVAGVQVSSNDGQPGSAQEIVIRGAGSLTQSTAPLYVIDGFPSENFDARSLNSEDIESINVLKDASATAIYGARASNGVIIIETKKGKLGKPVVSLNSLYGFQATRKQMDLMDPFEYVSYQYERNPVSTTARYLTDGRTLESYKDVKGINWANEVFTSSPYLINNVAIRGGTEKTKYSISGSTNNQHGIISNTGTQRYQGRISLDQTINSKLKVGVYANYSNNSNSGIIAASSAGSNTTTYLFSNIWGYRPINNDPNIDLLDADFDPLVTSADNARFNPVVTVENTNRVSTAKELLANAYLNYAINQNFTLRIAGTVNNRSSVNKNFYNSKTIQGSPFNPVNVRGVNGNISYSELNNWSNENTLSYQKTFNKVHRINAVAGFSMQSSSSNLFGVAVQNIPNEELGYSGFDEGIPYSSPASSSIFTLASLYARVNYSYKSKYLFTTTIRGDGSSKFAQGKKWGYFPSAAFAWNMAQEPFFKNLSFISESKIRVTYGLTGNNRVNDFAYLSNLGMPVANSYSWNNATPSKGIVPVNLGNLDLRWEVAEQIDLGYDLSLFNNRIELTADVYRKTTRDLLLNAQLPGTTGFSTAFKNIGKLSNEGLELSINSVNVRTPSFTWTSNFNISFNRNKVLELTEGQDKLFSFVGFESQYNTTPLYIAQIGKPVAMFYGYIFDGIYQYGDFDNPSPGNYVLKKSIPTNGDERGNIKPGDIKYKDINNDGVVNGYDQTIIGRVLPIHTGGFSNNFTYKNFDLNILMQWSYGNNIYNANRILFEGNSTLRLEMNQFASYNNRWTPTNASNTIFRVGGQGPLGRYSDRTIEDGSYLRLKTISLGYSIKSNILKRLNIKSLRVTAAAQNLLTWTKYSGMDPEVSSRNSILTPGFDFSAYPQAQTLVFGINASF